MTDRAFLSSLVNRRIPRRYVVGCKLFFLLGDRLNINMKHNLIHWIYWNIPFVGEALALWLSGDSTEFFCEITSERRAFDSPWGWHERIRHLERNGFFVSSAWKVRLMAQHKLWLFSAPILFFIDGKIFFADGSKGCWVDDQFVEIV